MRPERHTLPPRELLPEELSQAESADGAALGQTGYMGESTTSPGLGADLSSDHEDED
jgi:hypothetical protein